MGDTQKAKELWSNFENIPINNNDEIEVDFLHFETGTSRFEIWKWFEEKFGLSISELNEEEYKIASKKEE